ncbi:MAG: radical SAM protein [Myxococcota bacterium]
MRVLLINPSARDANGMGRMGLLFKPIPPLGVAAIAGSLLDAGVETGLIDQFGANLTNREVAALVSRERINLVGITALTASMGNILRLIKEIRRSSPTVRIVLGNVHATVYHRELVADGTADFVIRGEGEKAMVKLCRAIEAGASFESVGSLTWRKGDEVVVNELEPPLEMNSLPFPAWHLLDVNKYRTMPLLGVNRPMLHIQASRGCPYRCSFCSQEVMHSGFRKRSIESVLGEMEHFYRKFSVDYFIFTDAYFPFSSSHGIEFADALIKSGLSRKVKWICETRVDKVSAPMLRRLRESGLELIMFGFESGSQAVLNGVNKRQSLDTARNAARWAREAGIRTLGLFILGLPGETKETCEETVRFACELNPDFAKFNIAIPYPGSQFFDEWIKRRGEMPEFERFNSWFDPRKSKNELLFVPDGMTSVELLSLQRRAMLRFWARPQQVLRTLKNGGVTPKNVALGAYALISDYLSTTLQKKSAQSDA